ncbi:hypothetical protein ACFQU7_14725 [Pseudoroseomonas wenyumeiae]
MLSPQEFRGGEPGAAARVIAARRPAGRASDAECDLGPAGSLDRSDITGEQQDDGIIQVLDDLAYKQLVFVNVLFFGQAGQRNWVLIDAGIPASAGRIRRAAAARFGEACRPPPSS